MTDDENNNRFDIYTIDTGVMKQNPLQHIHRFDSEAMTDSQNELITFRSIPIKFTRTSSPSNGTSRLFINGVTVPKEYDRNESYSDNFLTKSSKNSNKIIHSSNHNDMSFEKDSENFKNSNKHVNIRMISNTHSFKSTDSSPLSSSPTRWYKTSFGKLIVSFGVGLLALGLVVSAVMIRTTTSSTSGSEDDNRMKRSPMPFKYTSSSKAEAEIDSIANRIINVASSERHESGSVPVPINVIVLSSTRRQEPDVVGTQLTNSYSSESSSNRAMKKDKRIFNNTTNNAKDDKKVKYKLNDQLNKSSKAKRESKQAGNSLIIDLELA